MSELRALQHADAGRPLALWRSWADQVDGNAVDAGHFFPEDAPELTAAALAAFFGASSGGEGVVRPPSPRR